MLSAAYSLGPARSVASPCAAAGCTASGGSRPLEGATLLREPPRGGSQHPTNQILPFSFTNQLLRNLSCKPPTSLSLSSSTPLRPPSMLFQGECLFLFSHSPSLFPPFLLSFSLPLLLFSSSPLFLFFSSSFASLFLFSSPSLIISFYFVIY